MPKTLHIFCMKWSEIFFLKNDFVKCNDQNEVYFQELIQVRVMTRMVNL